MNNRAGGRPVQVIFFKVCFQISQQKKASACARTDDTAEENGLSAALFFCFSTSVVPLMA